MREASRQRALEWIRTQLKIWDPIGLGAATSSSRHDEYDGYALGLLKLLSAGSDVARVASHLDQLCRREMGLDVVDEPGNRRAAERLVDGFAAGNDDRAR